MTQQNNKEVLLNTKMDQLGLGKRLNGYFCHKGISYLKDTPVEQIFTLREFIEQNQLMDRPSVYTFFITSITNGVTSMDSVRRLPKKGLTWQKLKGFLLDKGFTPQDWIHLTPEVKTSKGMKPDFSKMEKSDLLKMDVRLVSSIHSSTSLCILAHRIEEIDPDFEDNVTVGKVLLIPEINTNSKSFQQTMYSLQKHFKSFGLTGVDGPFMEIEFIKEKTYNHFVNEAMAKGRSRHKAEVLVSAAMNLGWIHPVTA